MSNFYISDLHLGHRNCLNFDQRPFNDVEEMTNTIVSNWNSVVKPHDTVYMLGDMFWHDVDAVEILSKLNGDVYLIKGNHDRVSTEMRMWFMEVLDYKEVNDNGRQVVLCHYPIAHWRNADRGTIHLYGHIHRGRDSRPFEDYVKQMRQREMSYECYNVGCMMPYMNYTPRTLDEIITGANDSTASE